MKRLALASILAVLGALIAVPTSAAAAPSPRVAASDYEDNIAVAGTPDFTKYYVGCNAYPGVEVCFQPHGDLIWVDDTSPDGSAAYGDWINQLKYGPNQWDNWRQGTCANHLGAYHWGYCNKDFYEWNSENIYGVHGSRVLIRGETDFGVDSGWITTDNDE